MSSTAIILYAEKVESSATQFGREVERETLTSGGLTDEKLEELVKNSHLMKDVEEAVRENAQRELDEYIGQKEDEAGENAREDLISERKAELSEKVIISQPPKRRRVREWRARSISEAIEVPITLPDKDIDDVSDEEFMIHDEDSEVWDEYLPSLRLPPSEAEAGGDDLTSLLGGDLKSLLRYLRQNGRSIDHLRELLREAKSSHLLEYDYYIDGMISLWLFDSRGECSTQTLYPEEEIPRVDHPLRANYPTAFLLGDM